MRRSLLVVPLALALAACSDKSNPAPDAGAQAIVGAPTLLSVSPALGAKAGGTIVSVLGTNLAPGTRLFVGASEATNVVWISDRRITARTTPSAVSGKVPVTIVNPDGEEGSLADGFEYIPPPSERTAIDSCQLVSPISLSVGAASQSDPIVGAVTAIGVTDFSGQGGKIEGQLGFGPDGVAPVDGSGTVSPYWTWIPADYSDSNSGSSYDGYTASLVGPAIGSYKYAFRFNYNGGAWTYCDLDGSENGFSLDEAGPMLVHGPTVDWCATIDPKQLSSKPGEPVTFTDGGVATITAQAYKKYSTTDDGQNVTQYVAQVGYGPANVGIGSDSWQWFDAGFVAPHTGQFGNNYEFAGSFDGPSVSGTYNFGYRIMVTGGPWTYCGLDNPIGATQYVDLGELDSIGLATADYCVLEGPATMSANAGDVTGPATSRIYKNGLTTDKSGGSASQITGQIGYGPAGKGPADPSWTWTDGTFTGANGGSFGNDYDYSGSFVAPNAGSYLYAFRYAINGGPWTFCNLDGLADGGSTARLGQLTTTGTAGPKLACRLEALSTGAISSGAPVSAVASVTIPGVTDSSGQGAGLTVQAGIGTFGVTFGWGPASYLADDGGSDLYAATLTPAYTGTRAVEFRVSDDDGGTWSVCDSSQIPDGGSLIVTNFDGGQGGITDCNLQWPPTLRDAGTIVYGHVTVPGITDSAGDAGAIVAELGWGQSSEDPGASAKWTWLPADFNSTCTTCGTAYEYELGFPLLDAGTYSYAYRYHLNGTSGPYCYGDQSGALDGFSGGAMGTATAP